MTLTRRHPTDADLIRALDRESNRVLAHAQQCDHCTRRLQRLERQLHNLSRRIEAADEPVSFAPVAPVLPEADNAGTRNWRRAAMFTLLLTGTGAMAWAAYRMYDAASVETSPVETVVPAPAAARPAVIAFVPVSDSVIVHVAARQQAGALHLAAHSTDSLTVTAAADIPLRVSERSVEIRNQSSARGDYRVLLPARIRHVLLIIASDTVRLERDALERQTVWSLAR